MFCYTRHAFDKFDTKEVRQFKISKKLIEKTIKEGKIVETEEHVSAVVGKLDIEHSLCVVFKSTGKDIKIITFFPAKKGRYERKVLQ